jgi:hypothetical protein
VEEIHGERTVAEIMARVPPEARRVLQPMILASAWYPIESIAAVHVGIRDVVGMGSWSAAHDLAAAAARQDFTGIHRAFLRSLTIDAIWSRLADAWGHYHTQGRVHLAQRLPTSARVIIDQVDGFNEGLWNAVAGRSQVLLEMIGARGAVAEAHRPSPTSVQIDMEWLT